MAFAQTEGEGAGEGGARTVVDAPVVSFPEDRDALAEVLAGSESEARRVRLQTLERDTYRLGSLDAGTARAWSLGLLDVLDRSEGDTAIAIDARRACLRMLSLVLQPEQLPRLTDALRDDDTRAEALAAVVAMEDAAASEFLMDRVLLALPRERIDVVRALARYDDARVSKLLTQLARTTSDPELAWACLESLSEMGVPPSRVGVGEGQPTGEQARRYASCSLRAAQYLVEAGHPDKARGLFLQFTRTTPPKHQLRAALLGLAATGQQDLAGMLIGYLSDPELRDTALALLPEALDTATAEELRVSFDLLPAPTQAALVGVRDRAGRPLADADRVRVSGASALVRYSAARAAGKPPRMTDAFDVAESGPTWLRTEALESALLAAKTTDFDRAGDELYALLQSHAPIWAQQRAIEIIGERGGAEDIDRLGALSLPPVHADRVIAALDRLRLLHGTSDAAALSAAALMGRAVDFDELSAVAKHARERGWPLNELLLTAGFLTYWDVRHDDAVTDHVLAAELPFGWPVPPEPETTEGEGEGIAAEPGEPVAVSLVTELTMPEWVPVYVQVWQGEHLEFMLNGERKTLKPDAERWSLAIGALRPGRNQLVLASPGEAPHAVAVRLTHRDGRPVDLTKQKLPDDGLKGVGTKSDRAKSIIDALP